jgi:hypothetical protein
MSFDNSQARDDKGMWTAGGSIEQTQSASKTHSELLLKTNLQHHEKEAVAFYQAGYKSEQPGVGYIQINRSLRTGNGSKWLDTNTGVQKASTPEQESKISQHAQNLKGALERHELPTGTEVFRGGKFTDSQISKFSIGHEFVDKGVVSTTLSVRDAEGYAARGARSKQTVVFHIAAGGSKGMAIPSSESEVLLAPGYRFRVKATSRVGAVHHIALEIVK